MSPFCLTPARLGALALILAGALHAQRVDEPINLWPKGAPGGLPKASESTLNFIKTKGGKRVTSPVAEPSLTLWHPAKPNGCCVVVAPGGGYAFLSAEHEGRQVCQWLNEAGVTAALLLYRTPTRDDAKSHEKPVADAARAIAHLRQNAVGLGIDPKRIGLIGFSAGGNLLAHLCCDRPAAEALPDFGIMIYGGGFLKPSSPGQPAALRDDFVVPSDAPPLFLLCAHDDGSNAQAAALLYLRYKQLGLSAELHLLTQGGHGFGMRQGPLPVHQWPKRCTEWMGAMGWLQGR